MSENWIDLLGRDLEKFSSPDTASKPTIHLVPGERREVAILFLDLAGFTALSENLDHEELHRISTGVMRALSSAVESSGGIVDKFEGDRMMALFGATVCRDNDCARAVGCALRLIETLEEISSVMEKHGFRISGRVGLNFGPVTVAPDPSGHITALGDEVNVASRLEQAADTGTALATARVREECGDLFEWEDLGEMMIRGRVKPVRTYRIDGPGRLQTARIRKASRLPEPSLKGRAGEIVDFLQFLHDIPDPPLNPRGGPRHRICMITGEAGSGKSRLLREFISTVQRELPGTVVLEGRVFPFGARPFSYWTSLLTNHAAAAVRSGEPEQPPLLGLLKGSAGEAALSQKEINQEVRDFVLQVARTAGSVLLVVDDCQWMDQASMDALEFTLANCDTPAPLLLLCAGRRSDESDGRRPAIHENYADSRRIEVGTMTEGEICSILASMLDYDSPEELAPDLRRFIIRRSGCNPRFAREILLDMIETGVMEETGGGWLLRTSPEEGRIPSSLSGAVRSRIDRLPPRLRKALQISAVLGFEFPADLYRRTAARLGQPESSEDLHDLVQLGILSSQTADGVETVTSNDELSMKAAYDGLLFQNRILVHRCAAEALVSTPELRHGESGMIARHLSRAGDLDEAARWAVRAALEASGASQGRSAAQWASSALKWLENLPSGEERTTLVLEALRILRHSFTSIGEFEGLEEALQEETRLSRELEMPGRTGKALQILCRLKSFQGKVAEAGALAEEGLAAASVAGDEELRGVLLTEKALLMMRTGRVREAGSVLQEAYLILEKAGRIDATSQVLSNLASSLISVGDLEGARPYLDKALSLVKGSRFRSAEASTLANLGLLDGMSGRLEDAVEKLRSALEIQELTGDRRDQGVTLNNLGKCLIELGDYEGAKRILRQALLIHRETGKHINEANSLENLGCIFLRDGDLNRARLHLEDSLRIYESSRYPFGCISSRASLGMVEAEAGSIDVALEHYNAAFSVTVEMRIASPAAESLKDLRDLLIKKGVSESSIPLPPGWSSD